MASNYFIDFSAFQKTALLKFFEWHFRHFTKLRQKLNLIPNNIKTTRHTRIEYRFDHLFFSSLARWVYSLN